MRLFTRNKGSSRYLRSVYEGRARGLDDFTRHINIGITRISGAQCYAQTKYKLSERERVFHRYNNMKYYTRRGVTNAVMYVIFFNSWGKRSTTRIRLEYLPLSRDCLLMWRVKSCLQRTDFNLNNYFQATLILLSEGVLQMRRFHFVLNTFTQKKIYLLIQ